MSYLPSYSIIQIYIAYTAVFLKVFLVQVKEYLLLNTAVLAAHLAQVFADDGRAAERHTNVLVRTGGSLHPLKDGVPVGTTIPHPDVLQDVRGALRVAVGSAVLLAGHLGVQQCLQQVLGGNRGKNEAQTHRQDQIVQPITEGAVGTSVLKPISMLKPGLISPGRTSSCALLLKRGSAWGQMQFHRKNARREKTAMVSIRQGRVAVHHLIYF